MILIQKERYLKCSVIVHIQWRCNGSSCELIYASIIIFDCYNPCFKEVEKGYIGFTISLSVCGQNGVHPVPSKIFVRCISYLHIILSNFRSCDLCKNVFQTKRLCFDKFFKFVSWTCFHLGSNMNQWYEQSWGGGGGGGGGLSSECRHSICSSYSLFQYKDCCPGKK